jgi:type IX secretion system PorP/SprF family membrane protein
MLSCIFKNMKKAIILVVLILSSSFTILFGQQDNVFSHYMYANNAFNPGAAGNHEKICATLLQRSQWNKFDGAPQLFFGNVNMDFNLFGLEHGVGLTFSSDEIGFMTNQEIALSYAQRLEVGNGKLGIGVSGGFINHQLEPKWKTVSGLGIPEQMFTEAGSDPAIPEGGKHNPTPLHMGFGMFYRTYKMFMGFSVTHIVAGDFDYNKASMSLAPHYYLDGGYRLEIPNTLFEINPSFLIATDLKATTAMLNANVVYNKKFSGGVSYRMNAFVTMIGFELLKNLHIGFAYDWEISGLSNYYTGSQELRIQYCFDIEKDKSPKQYKSIRFL